MEKNSKTYQEVKEGSCIIVLEVLVKLICALIITITGTYIINKVTSSKKKIKLKSKEILLILTLSIGIAILHRNEYTGLSTVVVFLLDIIIFKLIYNLSLEESIISCAIFMLILIFSDTIATLIFMSKFPIEMIRSNKILSIISNVVVSILSISLINIKWLNNSLNKFYYSGLKRKAITNLLFFILLVIGLIYLLYNIGSSSFLNTEYILNFIMIIIFTIVTYIFIENQNKYKKLEDEYDTLFKYIQNFEDWIEKEQLNRHEYKNQLAVLRCLTKEKKVKNKIDEILEDNINIEGQAVTNLKNLPKGGIKGLMYYKSAIAQKQKINLITDVSIEDKGILSKLSEKDIKVLCKLIGIYFDNAIEAAAESRKKNLTIEIYELKDKVNIVFSNTFKKHKNMKERNKKGVSSKGEGRGNGLYFASKLIKENTWIEERQEIIDNYYIQELTIKKRIS